MSPFKNNSLAVAFLGALLFGAVATQGCSSDEQNKPAGGAGSGGSSHAGTGGKKDPGTGGGKPGNEGGAAGQGDGEGGSAGQDIGAGGDGGSGQGPCDLSYDNSALTAITDNGGKLPALP